MQITEAWESAKKIIKQTDKLQLQLKESWSSRDLIITQKNGLKDTREG